MIINFKKYIKENKMYKQYTLIPLTYEDLLHLKEDDKLYIDKYDGINEYIDTTVGLAEDMIKMIGKINDVYKVQFGTRIINDRIDIIHFKYYYDKLHYETYYFPANICYRCEIISKNIYKPKSKLDS